MRRITGLICLAVCIFSCTNKPSGHPAAGVTATGRGTYAFDARFLASHLPGLVELRGPGGQDRILVSAAYQGRVMTSTSCGDTGLSYGWINYDLIKSEVKRKQFNPVGGEERFWLGPEGGQFGLYFAQGDSFRIAHWQVPAVLDTLPYTILHQDSTSVLFSRDATLTNYSGFSFTFQIQRKISLLGRRELEQDLHTGIPDGVHLVAYKSTNTITNTGSQDWVPEKGLLSIWLLGMFTPSDQAKVLIPFRPIPQAARYVTDDYFGKIPAGRLVIGDSLIIFTCDGKARGKIGISPRIAKPVAGCFDFKKNILTIIIPQVDEKASYVNSKWERQKAPYQGDVINAYNDGPLADGSQLGPFYEIESSSPALALKKGAAGTYQEITCHFQGDYADLRSLALALLHADLDQLRK